MVTECKQDSIYYLYINTCIQRLQLQNDGNKHGYHTHPYCIVIYIHKLINVVDPIDNITCIFHSSLLEQCIFGITDGFLIRGIIEIKNYQSVCNKKSLNK